MPSQDATESYFIRGYLWGSRRFAKERPISGDDWVSSTVVFGKKVVMIGVALFVLCAFLPNDWRRLVFVGMAGLLVIAGHWTQRNAQAIFDAAQREAGALPPR